MTLHRHGPAVVGFHRESRQATNRALALDPSLPEAWEELGQMQLLVDWDWTAANTSYQRALALDPDNVAVIRRAALMKDTMGELDDELTLDQRAIELDPLDWSTQIDLSSLYLSAGRADDAMKVFDAIPPDPRNSRPDYRIYLDLVTGRVADAAADRGSRMAVVVSRDDRGASGPAPGR